RTAHLGGIELETTERPRLGRPKELVALVAVQEVVFGEAFIERLANGEAHDHQPDAQRREALVEATLIEVELAAPREAVQRRGGRAVNRQHVEPQPSAVE